MGIRIGVIGGGASGMMAAISAAKCGAKVTILEGGERVGRKLLSTGNGKCNYSNQELSAEAYHCKNSIWLQESLDQFGAEDAIRFFQGLGMLTKSKAGYLYPASEQASAVLDVLRNELTASGVEVVTSCKVKELRLNKGEARFAVSDGKHTFYFDKIVLACGGKAAPKTGSDGSGFQLVKSLGLHILPTVPALVQLTVQEDYLKAVSGVRCEGEICVMREGDCLARECGEIQLTDYGISGIPTFQLSRTVNYVLLEQPKVRVILNLLPDMDEEAFETMIRSREKLKKHRTVEEFFTGVLNKKLMMLFIKLAGLKPGQPAAEAPKEALRRVYELCRHFELHVNGSKSYEQAQVCAGGVDVAEVTATMEAVKVPGLYIIGEMLDVDGRCGGYNLHWAWCSGYLAGRAAAEEQGTPGKKSER